MKLVVFRVVSGIKAYCRKNKESAFDETRAYQSYSSVGLLTGAEHASSTVVVHLSTRA